MVSHTIFESVKCSSRRGARASPKFGTSRHQYALTGLPVNNSRNFIGPIPQRIFISSSKVDIIHKNNLLKHLSSLRGKVLTWHDRDLLPGEEWDSRIKMELGKADIVLYLVSSDSMATDYIQKVELPLIEERCQKGKCKLVPVIVRFCDWPSSEFAKFNVLPEKGEPVVNTKRWVDQDEAWKNVVDGIRRIISI